MFLQWKESERWFGIDNNTLEATFKSLGVSHMFKTDSSIMATPDPPGHESKIYSTGA